LRCSFWIYPYYFFPSLVDDTHNIFDLGFIVNAFSFDHFVYQLMFMGLVVRPCKCLTWSPSSLLHGFSLLYYFYCLSHEIRVWSIPFAFMFFFYF
jgi:hypothetical protein